MIDINRVLNKLKNLNRRQAVAVEAGKSWTGEQAAKQRQNGYGRKRKAKIDYFWNFWTASLIGPFIGSIVSHESIYWIRLRPRAEKKMEKEHEERQEGQRRRALVGKAATWMPGRVLALAAALPLWQTINRAHNALTN